MSSHGARCDRASDIPVASRSCPRAPAAFASVTHRALLISEVASRVESERAAKTELHAACDRRRFGSIWDVFHRQGPFVGSGGLYSPGPANAAPLLAMLRPLDDAHAPPWALRRSCTVWPVHSDSRRLFARRARRRSSRRQPPRLGPCSLDPDRSFWSACDELIRGQTPPTDFCNKRFVTTCGQPNPGSGSSQGRRPQPPSFSPMRRAGLPCGSVDARRAAQRPFAPSSVSVPPGCPGLPDRDLVSNAPPPTTFAGGV